MVAVARTQCQNAADAAAVAGARSLDGTAVTRAPLLKSAIGMGVWASAAQCQSKVIAPAKKLVFE